ncbi:hypothetical protein RFI_33223 [Reticulomyxa filosa]|uniref:Uncharacterized protein n=1 Tax=Reticulomyxa filosa TaxID=46433 RepID=X6LTW9_RETFI|nr:hypothetical protein RFI_33223 [Reticulomyxa filosa]|eukprot:ETO04175.1 hypothetical protein RFI_33223 [Reticulomyxa filosa]
MRLWNDLGILRVQFHASILNSDMFTKLQNLMFDKNTEKLKKQQLKLAIDTLIIDRSHKFVYDFQKVLERCFDEHFKKDSNGLEKKHNRKWLIFLLERTNSKFFFFFFF